MKFAKNIVNHTPIPHGGLYSMNGPGHKMVDYSSNVNPLGFPKSIKKLGRGWMAKIPVYPDPESKKLKKRLASHLKVLPANLVVGNGATEIIYNFCRTTLEKNTPVLIPVPTFGEYEAAARLCGAKLLFFKTMDLEKDLAVFVKKIPRNGAVFVCNPNNPTGTMTSKNSILQIIKMAKARNTFVFVDECFMELAQNQNQSVIDKIHHENLFVLRSLTKSFGLAGLRVGYGIGNKKLASILNKIKIPWNVSGLAQEVACLALSDAEFLGRTRRLLKTESKFLTDSISRLDGFSCLGTSANFILIRTRTNSRLLQKRLAQKNILIRDCSTFRGLGKNYIRIAIKTHNENLRLVNALEGLA
ncbi:MAG: threonine-phosphate decarboxylase CobD [Candidatus Nitrosotenuis sp.]